MLNRIARGLGAWLVLAAMLVSGIAGAATPIGTPITNTVQVSWKVGSNTVSAVAQNQVVVSPYMVSPSDLTISMTGPAQVGPAASIIWKAVATNLGAQPATGAQVTLTVPPGVTGISGVCVVLTSGACGAVTVGAPTAAGTPVTVSLPNLPVDGRVEITLRGSAPSAPATINNVAQVSLPGVIDPTPPNNVATVQTQVTPAAANTGTLSGRVWVDANHDRVRNAGEVLIDGFTVRIYNAAGTSVIREIKTDKNGAYSVGGLPAGVSYQVEFRDRAGNVVFGLPVTTEGSGTPAGFASTTSCKTLAETSPPNLVSAFATGNCYSLTNGGSSAQVQRTGRILVALQAGDNVVEQSLPLDPSGVVYDAVTRQAIAGATVTLTGPAGFNPALHLLGGVGNQNQITGADGVYQFLLVGGAPAGVYTIAVTPPAGYRSPSALIPAQAGAFDPTGKGIAGVFAVQAQPGPPTGAQPTTYYLAFDLVLGDPNVINNHIPLDPGGGAGASLEIGRAHV